MKVLERDARPVGAEVPDRRPRDHAAAAARPASVCCATAARSGCSPSIYATLHLTDVHWCSTRASTSPRSGPTSSSGPTSRSAWRPSWSWSRWRSPPTTPWSAPGRRRLGSKLHRWVYLAAAAAAVHFVMVVKVLAAGAAGLCRDRGLLLAYRLVLRLQRSPAPNRVRAAHGGRRPEGTPA